ncbi:hypothetical protein ACFY8X_15075 [Streptomyces tanashiensis]|uniref:hypothetical protein n=1 Tax=Streptomyces tanashiensis TaxID=67367 RepID=UPI0036F068B8
MGRALHLANAYEDKCQYVLRVGNLITAHQAAHAMGQTMDMDTLHKARQARNWIAR